MGLPLFVAPVESDLNTKTNKACPYAADRSAQSRSAIRRSRRADDRESRTTRRRAAFLNDNPSGLSEPLLARIQAANSRPSMTREIWVTNSRNPNTVARYPWVESGSQQQQQLQQQQQQQVPQRVNRPEDDADVLERVARNHQSLFDGSLFSETEPESFRNAMDRDRRRRRDSRHANRDSEEQDADSRSYRRSNIAPSVAARFDRSPDPVAASLTVAAQHSEALRGINRRLARYRRSREVVDGLGDRNRSLSPEVWDTLLTTLTPDPQPPSVGSSFASATASTVATSQSQSAAASSRTSLAEPDGPAADQPCETGDASDSESGDWLSLDAGPDHPTLTVPSRFRRFISSLNPHDVQNTSHARAEPADRPTLTFNGRPDGVWTNLDRIRSRMQHLREAEAASRARTASASGAESGTEQQTIMGTTREGSEEESESLDQGDLEPAGGGGSLDMALGGMQRIVRGLVERRDIPDEWWAEAGLSRLISDDA